MSNRPIRLLLDDILESIDKIWRYTSGLDRESFLHDEKTVDSVARNLEIIGEADECIFWLDLLTETGLAAAEESSRHPSSIPVCAELAAAPRL